VPPLRERPADIPQLVRHFMEHFSRENNVRLKRITPAALEALQRHRWKGNIRELRNTVERVIIMTGKRRHRRRGLPENVRSPAAAGGAAAKSAEALSAGLAVRRHEGGHAPRVQG